MNAKAMILAAVVNITGSAAGYYFDYDHGREKFVAHLENAAN